MRGRLDEEEEPRGPTRASALRLLGGIYGRADRAYAAFSCSASGECCQLARTRRPPWLWAPEWMAIAERLRSDGRALPPRRSDGACPFLTEGARCSIYSDRPFGCRTFFCGRARGPAHHPTAEVVRLSRKIEELSRAVAPDLDAPRPLGDWLEEQRCGS